MGLAVLREKDSSAVPTRNSMDGRPLSLELSQSLSHLSDRGAGLVVLILQTLNLWVTPREEQPRTTPHVGDRT